MTDTLAIVTLNVSVTEAPAPSTLQQSGAMVSIGGTSTPPDTLSLVPTLAALKAILAPPLALSSITWASGGGGTATGTTTAPHGWPMGLTFPIDVTGATPSGYDVTNSGATVTGANTFTYSLASNPGAETVAGFVTPHAVSTLLTMGLTYFAGLSQQAPYVLELGLDTVTNSVTALGNWIDDNPLTIYSYLMPRAFGENAAFQAFVNDYTAPNKLTYFFTTITTGDVTGSPPVTPFTGMKDVWALVESPTQNDPVEFTNASPFASSLAMNPSSTNRATGLAYAPAYGCTAYPRRGNAAQLLTLAEASVNFIDTGTEGGINTNIIKQGFMQDDNQWLFWYSGDWFQINSQIALANEVINGAQPGGNPLLYNQDGINRLSNRIASTARQAVANGLANGQVKQYGLPFSVFQSNYNAGLYEGQIPINAEPFLVYAQNNPSDYRQGKYGGLSAVYTPSEQFINIFFNLNITNLLVP